jgi:S-adenosylmethionine:tRNA ribosyltransferase-isomerase
MDLRDFDFDLPPGLIAQEPAADRSSSRLLHVERATGALAHHRFADLPRLLSPGDLLVVNDTRVFPARLLGRRMPSGGAVECLLLRRCDEHHWEALVHPGQNLKAGAQLVFDHPPSRGARFGAPGPPSRERAGAAGPPTLRAEILERHFHGRRLIRLWTESTAAIDDVIDEIGHVPLPPYIKRDDRETDRDRYQTIFATHRGSIAAPTAGLHFTESVRDALRARDVQVAAITLHVGYGTFQPVRTERVEDHQVEAEWYEVGEVTAGAINTALDEQRRVIAVGTTTTRTLEAVAASNRGRLVPGAGQTDLFIYPGFRFQVISGLLTNFHLPQSSLLMLVAAFAGRERILAAYRNAVEHGYKFYSYGDATLIL